MTAKTASVLNCRVRYACAPSSTAWPMDLMLSVPSGAASTSWRNSAAIARRDDGDDGHDDHEGDVASGEGHRRRIGEGDR